MIRIPYGIPEGVPQTDGTYGMAVYATVVPSFVEFSEALETGVGTGTYGSFVVIPKIPSVQDGWTICTRLAPNDGLRRQMKARHVRDGATSSAFTSVITVTPWGTPSKLPAPPPFRVIPFADDFNYAATADATGQVFLNGAGTSSTQKVNVGTTGTPASMQRIYRIPWGAFQPQSPTITYFFSASVIPGTANVQADFVAPVTIPIGSTIVGFAIRARRSTVSDLVTAQLTRAADTVTTGISALTHATTGWATVSSGSLSDLVSGGTSVYYIALSLKGVAAAANGEFAYAEITVTVPDLNTGL